MNLSPVWITAVSLLSPFVKKAGEKLAEKAGESLYRALESRFSKDKDRQGRQVLKQYAADAEMYEGALTKLLERRAADESFRSWLEEQVAQAYRTSGGVSEDVIVQTVEVKGQTGDIVGKVGGDYVKGSKIELGKKQ